MKSRFVRYVAAAAVAVAAVGAFADARLEQQPRNQAGSPVATTPA